MALNSKRYLILAESSETTIVRSTRPIFRKVYCPFCGAETDLFRRDDDQTPADGSHTLHCEHQAREFANGAKYTTAVEDQ